MVALVGISGKIGSGKNYLAEQVEGELTRLGFTHSELSFGIPLKNELSEIIAFIRDSTNAGVSRDQLLLKLAYKFRFPGRQAQELVDGMFDEVMADSSLTGWSRTRGVRGSLQFWGTHVRRRQDDNYWVKLIAAMVEEQDVDFVFATDARFLNEINFVVDREHGVGVRLDIPESVLKARRESRDGGSVYTEAQLNHESETTLDDYPRFDLVVGEVFDTAELTQQIIRKANL